MWVFYTIPEPGETGGDTWENDSWAIHRPRECLGADGFDETRGLLYCATSTPSGDYWRPAAGANLFAESLLPRCDDGRKEVAFSGGAPWPLGLRLPGRRPIW